MTENSAFWDADTYDIVSNAQEEWAKFIIKQRKWSGNEVYLTQAVAPEELQKCCLK